MGLGSFGIFEEDLMTRMNLSGTLLAGVMVAVVGPGSATAQPQAGVRSAASAYASPVTNPYANPYMNPYMMMMPMSRDTALLSLLAAQRSSGGIGSGRLSGLPAAQATRAAEMPDSLNRPGGAAARYFSRGTSGGPDLGRAYYQRHNRYFGSNGR